MASVVATVCVKAYTPLHFMLYGVVSVMTCVVVGYLASLVLPGRIGDPRGLTLYTRLPAPPGRPEADDPA